jgi:dTDP-4-dehydrorhamnose 3,5-epimerase
MLKERLLMIDGVEIKTVKTHGDERGFFREILRASDPILKEGFAQWSHTMSFTGVAKGWHVHQTQFDWWYLAVGVIKVALYDTRPNSPTHGKLMELLMGEQYGPVVVKIPPGVAHGYRVLDGPVHLFYIVSQEYDGTDEGRIAQDSPEIGYDWSAWPEIT